MLLTRIFILSVIGVVLFSCKPKLEAPEPSLGDINPKIYVAIGTDGTAGFSDDALNYNGQMNSFASILAIQFNTIGACEFNQPLMNESIGGVNLNGQSKLILGYKTDCNGETSLSPVRKYTSGDLTAISGNYYGTFPPSDNLGIPHASILKISTSGYGNPANGAGNFNPFYRRIASNETGSSILSDAVSRNATFYTISLGDADIMEFAASGGTSGPMPAANGAAGAGFDGSLEEVILSMAGNGARGAIANIPDVMNFPFFTTIPYDGLNLDAANTITMNSVFNPLGIYFQEGDNPFTIEDAAEPFGVRKMVEGERVLLSVPLDSIKCYGMGSISPIPNRYILTLDEIAEIEAKINEYNSVILAKAQAHGLAHVNAKTVIQNIKNGIVYNGVTMNTNFVTGGAFSLDGKNLNPIGQAILANAFIESINQQFNAAIPFADVTKFSGVIFP